MKNKMNKGILEPLYHDEIILSTEDWNKLRRRGVEAKFSYVTIKDKFIQFTMKTLSKSEAIIAVYKLFNTEKLHSITISDEKVYSDDIREISMIGKKASFLIASVLRGEILQIVTDNHIYNFYPMGLDILMIKWPSSY